MTKLEALLRISLVQAELLELAAVLDPHTSKVLTYAHRVLRLVKPDKVTPVATPEIETPIPKTGA